jgi:hypothetical protein
MRSVELLPIMLRPHELSAYRAAVTECSSAAEREACERLLGQLASLEAATARAACVAFFPAPRNAAVAYRALAAMRRNHHPPSPSSPPAQPRTSASSAASESPALAGLPLHGGDRI